jgi:hypothetical protein
VRLQRAFSLTAQRSDLSSVRILRREPLGASFPASRAQSRVAACNARSHPDVHGPTARKWRTRDR